MAAAATATAREARDSLARFDRDIAKQFGALRRWHSSEYQTVGGVTYVGDLTDGAGSTSISAEDWRSTVKDAEERTSRLRSPLVGALQAASARAAYWRSECDRLARKAS
jgi:hypothetical protein